MHASQMSLRDSRMSKSRALGKSNTRNSLFATNWEEEHSVVSIAANGEYTIVMCASVHVCVATVRVSSLYV